MNSLKTIWLSALTLLFALAFSHGMFSPIAVSFCGAALFLLLGTGPAFLEKFSFNRFLSASLIVFGLLTLFPGILLPRFLIYVENQDWLSAIKIGGGLFATLGLFNFVKPSRNSLWIALPISTFMMVAVVIASPHPMIDVWTIHETCANAIVHGLNPYTVSLTNPYPVNIQASITPLGMNAVYLPGIYLLMAPLSALGLDTRLATVFALLGISILLFLFARRSKALTDFQKLLIPVLFLANPLNLFLIEQSWNDAIGAGFFIFLIFTLSSGRAKLLPLTIALTGTLLSKQYFWPLSLLVLLWGYRTRAIPLRKLFLACVPTVFVLGFFSFLDWRNFWGSLYGLQFLKNGPSHGFLDVRWNSLSLIVGTKYFTGLDLSSLGTLVSGVGIIWIAYLLLKTDKIFSLGKFILCMGLLMFVGVFLSPVANFNYYIAVWSFIFLFLVSFGENEIQEFLKLNFSRVDATFIFTRILIITSVPIFTDVIYYQQIVAKLAEHAMPYRDFHFEYPPLTLVVLFITKCLTTLSPKTDSFPIFRFWFQITLFSFDYLAFRWLKTKSETITKTYLFLPLFLFPLWYDRFDLVVGILIMIAAVQLFNRETFRSFVLIALGGLFKIIPIIELMVFSSQNFFKAPAAKRTSSRFREKREYLAILLVSIGLSFMFRDAWSQVLSYHSDRPIQAESIWASIDYLYRNYTGSGDFSTFITHGFGSYGIAPYLDLDFISRFAMPASLFILGIFFLGFYRRHRFEKFHMLIPLILFMSLSRVFSPQYVIWLVPLIGISEFKFSKKLDRWILLLSYIICGLSSIILMNYMDFVQIRMDLWLYLTVRNFSCLAMFAMLMGKLWGERETPSTPLAFE
jgi:hypothetical protein